MLIDKITAIGKVQSSEMFPNGQKIHDFKREETNRQAPEYAVISMPDGRFFKLSEQTAPRVVKAHNGSDVPWPDESSMDSQRCPTPAT
jgi:hypothetical protein